MSELVDNFLEPGCLVIPISGDGKAPLVKFGGWKGEPVPGGRQAYWNHENTVSVGAPGDGYDIGAHEVVEAAEERGINLGLIDVDGANLGVLDIDLVDDSEDADREDGKWHDREAAWEFARGLSDGTLWRSQSGAPHVPVLFTDEAYEKVFDNEYKAGWGVDSIKGPAGKGYTLSPFSSDYSVERSGGAPVLGLDDLKEMDEFEESDVGTVRALEPGHFDPVISRERAEGLESTTSMPELFSAINHVGPDDFVMESERADKDRRDGTVHFNPFWRHSETGESLAYLGEKGVFYDLKEDKGFFADKLVALEEGVISSPHDNLAGADWWRSVEVLRERGAPVPEWGLPEPSAGVIAPYSPIGRADPAADGLPDMDLSDVRGQTRNIVSEAIGLGTDAVIRIPVAGGKTHAAVKELAERSLPSAYAVNTHRNANEACELMAEEGFHDFALPPSASRTGLDQEGEDLEHLDDTHCPTFTGEHGEDERERMQALVDATDGSTRLVHKIADSDENDIDPFPCQEGDRDCNYVEAWDRWDADATVQVCHYTHLKMVGITAMGEGEGVPRSVFIDEFPDNAFQTSWTGSEDDNRSVSKLKEDVMAWLSGFGPRPPASGEDVWDAIDNETECDGAYDALREARTLEDLAGRYVPWDAVKTRDIEGALDHGWHPATSLVAYLYAKGTRLENGWRHARAGKYALAVEPNGDVHLLRPPNFGDARQVVGLDATACEPMWRAVTGLDGLNAVDSMTTRQKRAYYKKALNIDVVQVSDWMKSMAGVGNAGNEAFRADHAELVIDYIEHAAGGEETGLITSKQALAEMRKAGVGLDRLDMTGYYGNFKGENRFGGVNVGAVFGSNHPGDRAIERWAAYRGESAERNERPEGDQSDWELSYQSDVADEIFDYYLEGAVVQAIARFSRNEERGLVVVYTDRIPDHVPRHKAGLTSFAESRGDVLEAIENGAEGLDQAAARVQWCKRTVRRAISELESAGAVERGPGGELRAKGPVSRVGSIGGDRCPIILYRETVEGDDEELRSDPLEAQLLGVRALLMDVAGDGDGGDDSVQTSLSPALGAD